MAISCILVMPIESLNIKYITFFLISSLIIKYLSYYWEVIIFTSDVKISKGISPFQVPTGLMSSGLGEGFLISYLF